MDARLYELIRDFLRHRDHVTGVSSPTFRLSSLRAFAEQHPSRYPEYVAHPERLPIAIRIARQEGQILPLPSGGRDDDLTLKGDSQ